MSVLGMGPSETATARAVTAIESLLSEPGRKALLRREVIAAGVTPRACDRALRRLRAAGVIARFGQGIYGPADVKLFAALDEILERLGIESLPGGPAKGYSQYLAGNVVRTRRRVTRRLRQRGVQIYFENPEGKIMQRRPAVRSQAHEMPSKREIEEHFHSFLQCHSLARAEKDLLVGKALAFMEGFDGGGCSVALEGGTALARYYGVIHRFSEDLDIRFLPPEGAPPRGSPGRIALFRNYGDRFSRSVEKELPWLRRLKKGRMRPDGSVQPLIFGYKSSLPSGGVVTGIKFEFVDIRRHLPVETIHKPERDVLALDPAEIAAGKWLAVAGRIPGQKQWPELVRHPADLAQFSSALGPRQAQVGEIARASGICLKNVRAAIQTLLRDPSWQEHYESYMRRMGTRPVSEFETDHLPWAHVGPRLCGAAVRAGLVERDDLVGLPGWGEDRLGRPMA